MYCTGSVGRSTEGPQERVGRQMQSVHLTGRWSCWRGLKGKRRDEPVTEVEDNVDEQCLAVVVYVGCYYVPVVNGE